jgi:hypothetical protein
VTKCSLIGYNDVGPKKSDVRALKRGRHDFCRFACLVTEGPCH